MFCAHSWHMLCCFCACAQHFQLTQNSFGQVTTLRKQSARVWHKASCHGLQREMECQSGGFVSPRRRRSHLNEKRACREAARCGQFARWKLKNLTFPKWISELNFRKCNNFDQERNSRQPPENDALSKSTIFRWFSARNSSWKVLAEKDAKFRLFPDTSTRQTPQS